MSPLARVGLTRRDVERIAGSVTLPPVPRPGPPAGVSSRCLVMQVLADGPADTDQLIERTHLSEDSVRMVLGRMSRDGKIVKDRDGKPGHYGWPSRWRLA